MKKKLNVTLTGSRDWNFPNIINDTIKGLDPVSFTICDSDHGPGKFAKRLLQKKKKPYKTIDEDLSVFEKKEDYLWYHEKILKNTDVLIIFVRGHSRIQQMLFETAKTKDIPVIYIRA